jgi:DNA-binding NarL/FixJ family response regulator
MRVLLATDQADLGHALSLFLSEQSIEVVDVVGDVDRLMTRASTVRPDVVLVDWSLGEAVSSLMVSDLMRRDDPTPVIVLSTAQDRPRARRCGATAYALLGDPPDSLLEALREVEPDPSSDAGTSAR